MALQRADSIGDSTTSTGTGTITLTGTAPQGHLPIVGNITDGATIRVRIFNYDAADPSLTNTDWEVVEGVYTASGATLTRVTVYESSTGGAKVNFAAGTKAVVLVVTAADFAEGVVAATGGTITTDGNYKVHSFTTGGTLTVTVAGWVYLLLVGGGGGGAAGGGGAGGVQQLRVWLDVGSYTVTIGTGGASVANAYTTVGNPGAPTSFGPYVAFGGGAGNKGDTTALPYTPRGSGGGGGHSSTAAISGGIGTPGQGYDGGATTVLATPFPAAGGGGASAAGASGSGSTAGNGGAGIASSISGSSVNYGGGGGGGVYNAGTPGSGGNGGGGNGAQTSGTASAGTANSGGGGGGSGTGGASGAGGSGIAIARYKFQ